tara:strand:- start:10394 stop:10837 length:444 start_codon:yes stop_codon:yes gene_type:complete
MANRDFKFTQAIEREVKFLAFQISGLDIIPAGAGAEEVFVTATPSLGIKSVRVHATAPGGVTTIDADPLITVTLEDKYNGLLSCVATTGAGAACQFVSFSGEMVAVDGSFSLKLGSYEFLDTGTGVVPTASDIVQVLVTLKNTSVAR